MHFIIMNIVHSSVSSTVTSPTHSRQRWQCSQVWNSLQSFTFNSATRIVFACASLDFVTRAFPIFPNSIYGFTDIVEHTELDISRCLQHAYQNLLADRSIWLSLGHSCQKIDQVSHNLLKISLSESLGKFRSNSVTDMCLSISTPWRRHNLSVPLFMTCTIIKTFHFVIVQGFKYCVRELRPHMAVAQDQYDIITQYGKIVLFHAARFSTMTFVVCK